MNSNSVKLKLLKDISDAIGDEHPRVVYEYLDCL